MQNPFVDSTWKNPIQFESPPAEIVPGASGALLPAANPLDEKFACLQRYGNMSLNSRQPFLLPKGTWKIRWRMPLQSDFLPNLVMVEGDRIVVQGSSSWQLLSTEGKPITSGKIGGGDIIVDRTNKLFYVMDELGYLAARELDQGRLAFLMGVDLGNQFSRPFITRVGRSMILVGIGKKTEPHTEPENRSQIELYDLGERLNINPDHVLESFDKRGSLVRRSRLLHAAMRNQEIVIAAENYVYRVDPMLRVRSAVTGNFVPLALSLDESDQTYLILRTERGALAMWVLNHNGERSVNFDLQESSSRVFMPPAVSYDHRAFLVIEDRIISIDSHGTLEWDKRAAGPIAGLTVTADGTVAVSEGSYLNAFDAQGERRFVYAFQGEQLATQPFILHNGDIYIASTFALYSLVPQNR